jgi:hypothetical protein
MSSNFESRVDVSTSGSVGLIFKTKLVEESIAVIIHGDFAGDDKLQLSGDNPFASSSFHILGPKHPVSGIEGYQALTGLLDCINSAIKYVYNNNKKIAVSAKVSMLEDEPVPVSPLFKNGEASNIFEARSSIIFDPDTIVVSKNGPVISTMDDIHFNVNCWQGTCNLGIPGFVKIMAMKNTIERALSSINMTHPEFHVESKAICSKFDTTRDKPSSCELTC